jgi:hypothetical protein
MSDCKQLVCQYRTYTRIYLSHEVADAIMGTQRGKARQYSLLQCLGAYIEPVKYADTKYMGRSRLCTVTHDNDKSFPTHIRTFDAARLITSEARYTYNRIAEAIAHHTQIVQRTKRAMPEGCLSVEDSEDLPMEDMHE